MAAAAAAVAAAADLDGAPARFIAALEARAVREPRVAAYFLAGLADPASHDLRRRLAPRAPHVVAFGLRGVGDETAWRMRQELEAVSPRMVARSLFGLEVEGARAEAMREALAAAEPTAVLSTLGGNDGPAAWSLRERLVERDPAQVVSSLKRLAGERAWQVRDHFLHQAGGEAALADPAVAAPLVSSLRGLGGVRAWTLRRLCFEAAPVQALASLVDVADEESWAWREAWFERAPKVVLRTLVRQSDPRGFAMRRAVGGRVKEALDAMSGDDSDAAWDLREALSPTWPSTAIKSLGPLYAGARGRQLAARLCAEHPDDISLLKHVTALEHDAAGASARGQEDEG